MKRLKRQEGYTLSSNGRNPVLENSRPWSRGRRRNRGSTYLNPRLFTLGESLWWFGRDNTSRCPSQTETRSRP